MSSIKATIASNNSNGVFSVRIDNPTGPQIGSYTVQSTGSWTTWKTVTIPITATTDVHTLCLHGESGTGIANILTIQLEGVCVPECTGASCGADGCGGKCGTCGFGVVCDDAAGQCVAPPTKYSLNDPTLATLIPAPAYDDQSGTQLSGTTSVGSFDANDYLCYYDVDLTGVASFETSLASANSGGVLSIRIDSPTGSQIGSYTVASTGRATTWKSKRIPISIPTVGVHAVCIRGESGSGIASFQSFQLSSAVVMPKWTVGSTIPAAPPDSQQGTTTETAGYISYFDSTDFVCYDDVDLTGVNSIVANIGSSNGGGVFSVRVGSPTGTRIGTFVASNTGGWTNWVDATSGIAATTGMTTLCFRGESGDGIANLRTFYLSSAAVTSKYAVGSTIPAAPPDSQQGTTTETAGYISYFDSSDYVCYNDVNMAGVNSIVANVSSSNNGGVVSVRVGSPTGTQIGTIGVPNTGSWTNWKDVAANVSATAGVTTLCFRGESSGEGIANLRTFYLSPTGITSKYAVGSTIPAIPPDSQQGTTSNSAGYITYFDSGDWICYDQVDLTGVKSVVASAASATNSGQISVRIGSSPGSQIGSYAAWNTGGYTTGRDAPWL